MYFRDNPNLGDGNPPPQPLKERRQDFRDNPNLGDGNLLPTYEVFCFSCISEITPI